MLELIWQKLGTVVFTLAIIKCYGKVRVLFFPRDNSHFTRQVAHFTRSWSSGKMLAFQPRGFVFEPVGMRLFLVGAFLKKRVDYSHGFSSVFF